MPDAIEVGKISVQVSAPELADLLDSGLIDADCVIAVDGRTAGNGGINDYTHVAADRAFREVPHAKGARGAAEVRQSLIVRSGGRGDPAGFVPAAAHQGPDGGAPVDAIVDLRP